ncbi:MAG: hypothetical protein RLZZ15_3917 [Verrucomicrobiota bacterium]
MTPRFPSARILVPALLLRAALLALASLAAPRAAAAETPSRPNILWLVGEDFTANYSGPYGDPLARTPHLSRLAAEGVTFDHFHSAAPVCAPSRSSIITGRYATSMGTQNMRSTRPLPDGVKFFPAFLREAGYFTTNNAKTDYNTSAANSAGAAAWDENSRTAHWRHRKAGQPFFAVFNHEQSHESRLHKREPLLTDPAKVRVPAYLPDTPEVRADLAQYFDCVARTDAAFGERLAELQADGLLENTIVFLYSDNGGAVSRSKRFLYDNGTHTALVTWFPPRHRALAPGAPGARDPGVANFVDLAPTVLSLAGLPRAPQFQGRALAGPARAPAPAFTFVFRDRMDERYDSARAATDGRFNYIRNFYPLQPWGQHIDYLWKQASMRDWARLHKEGKLTAAQRAFFEPKPAEELFDCTTDPDNVRNLAADPQHRAQLEKMRAALRAHLVSTRDTVGLPEPMMIALAAGRSPTAVTLDEKTYPLPRLLDLVDALQLHPESAAAVAEKNLRDPSPLVRYWAAVGGLGAKNSPTLATAYATALADAEPTVRLVAAEALLRDRDDPAAWQVLAKELQPDVLPELQLFALNVAARVKRPLAPVLLPRLNAFAANDDAGMGNYLNRAAADLLANAR